MDTKRARGQYFTRMNVFQHRKFREWFEGLIELISKREGILEPFVGDGSICGFFPEYKFHKYDIEPRTEDTIEQDTLQDFPKGYSVCITNPPYISKKTSTMRNLNLDFGKYDNLYLTALEKILSNCEYAAVIIPLSYINKLQKGLFRDRCDAFISLPYKVFEDTDFPVALVLFSPVSDGCPIIYDGDDCVGTLCELEYHDLWMYDRVKTDIKFNDSDGQLMFRLVDGTGDSRICCFQPHHGFQTKYSDRFIVRVKINAPVEDFDRLCEIINEVISDYRTNTNDMLITSEFGLRKDGKFRRRLDFKRARRIIKRALEIYGEEQGTR